MTSYNKSKIKHKCFICGKLAKHFLDSQWLCGNHRRSTKALKREVVQKKLGLTLEKFN